MVVVVLLLLLLLSPSYFNRRTFSRSIVFSSLFSRQLNVKVLRREDKERIARLPHSICIHRQTFVRRSFHCHSIRASRAGYDSPTHISSRRLECACTKLTGEHAVIVL